MNPPRSISPSLRSLSRRDAVSGMFTALALPLLSGVGVPRAIAANAPAARFPVRLHDMMVTDARSRTRFMLLRDLVRDRVAVVNFMFTGCSTVCPVQGNLLSGASRRLAREMGETVIFTSVSISPLTDTPEALVQFADSYAAGRGWHFLRAGVPETQRFQEGFDSLAPRIEDHPPMIAIGRANSASWSRLYGTPSPALTAAEVRRWLTTG